MFDVTTREIFLYDDIGPAWAGMFGTETLQDGLKTFGSGDVSLRINSYGGSVDEALAMLEILDRHDGDVVVSVDSIAASAASLFGCCFPSSAAAHSRVMIHNPWGISMGDASQMRKEADVLDVYRDSIVSVYQNSMNVDASAIREMMDNETWFSAEQAVAAGLIDQVGGKNADPAPVPQNRFKNAPGDLPRSKSPPRATNTQEAAARSRKLKMIQIRSKIGKSRR